MKTVQNYKQKSEPPSDSENICKKENKFCYSYYVIESSVILSANSSNPITRKVGNFESMTS